jgi:hypothetical protein
MTTGATPVPAVVERPEQLTAAWFDAVLGTAGTPASVERVTASPVGTGQMAQTLRVRLDRAAGSGSTVIVKLARPEVASGPLARSAYAKEIAFYGELAARLPVRTPRCHHAAIADDATSFTLVLDDLAGAVPGDQIAGCPVAHAEAAVVNLAALHGPTWCDAELTGRPWLAGDPSLTPEMLAPVLDLAADQFAERFTGDLEDHERAVLDAARQVLAPWMLAGSDTFSVIHGDYRLDNLLFPVDDPAGVAVVDWQTVSIAPAARDRALSWAPAWRSTTGGATSATSWPPTTRRSPATAWSGTRSTSASATTAGACCTDRSSSCSAVSPPPPPTGATRCSWRCGGVPRRPSPTWAPWTSWGASRLGR